MLAWYDRHQRVLPWRSIASDDDILPQDKAYSVWLSEIMLQQTVVKAVLSYFEKFTTKWPNVHDLAAAHEDDIMEAWAGLGYYSRARNLHKCAEFVSRELGGIFPDTEEGLLGLPGVGPYTAAAITAIAFNKPAVVIDGNVDRIMVRLYALDAPIRDVKADIRARAQGFFVGDHIGDDGRSRDFVQSLMDLGAGICIPKSPRCMLCPVRNHCLAHKKGVAAELPVPPKKKKKPHRHGVIYILKDTSGRILIEKRPDKGLLASTFGFPTSAWIDDNDGDVFKGDGPSNHVIENLLQTHTDLGCDIHELQMTVSHVFTHFSLSLRIKEVVLHGDINAPSNHSFIDKDALSSLGMPSLFDKVRRVIFAQG